uniref:Late endosomal/lysosomal adaptor and MAPK and MTOR activator 4 n=1 Tax=Parastrongyloides trichosuri TaxID=131310 RepID=A0A0N4ZE50_PARTI
MVNETNALSKISNATGFMMLSDGELVKSGGDLEGNVKKAEAIARMLSKCRGHQLTAINEKWNCLTIEFEDCIYAITVSSTSKQTIVVKKSL